MGSSSPTDPKRNSEQRNPTSLPEVPCPLVIERPSHGLAPAVLLNGLCPVVGKCTTHGAPGSPAAEVERDPGHEPNCDDAVKKSNSAPNLHHHVPGAGGRSGALGSTTAVGCT
jgi:hypothetical protein